MNTIVNKEKTNLPDYQEKSYNAIASLSEDDEEELAASGVVEMYDDDQGPLMKLLAQPSPPRAIPSPLSSRLMKPTKPSKASKLSKEVENVEDTVEVFRKNQQTPDGAHRPLRDQVTTIKEQMSRPPRTAIYSVQSPSGPSSITSKVFKTPNLFEQDGLPIDYGNPQALENPLHLPPKDLNLVNKSSSDRLAMASKLAVSPQFRQKALPTHRSTEPLAKPLRYRPLEQLTPEDFKINPYYNQGYDYAFTDVVRTCEQRRCLQGCTKRDCCGPQFLTMAALTRNPAKAPTLSQQDEDQRLLKDYLGDNLWKVRYMSENARNDALLHARARDLANKHGRHRQAYVRRGSPPGFWNPDFPTTQERADRRAEVETYERDLVEQRYREALRENGAYKFRDE